jgi:hypothetical protein
MPRQEGPVDAVGGHVRAGELPKNSPAPADLLKIQAWPNIGAALRNAARCSAFLLLHEGGDFYNGCHRQRL